MLLRWESVMDLWLMWSVLPAKTIMHATNVLEPIHCSLKVDWFASCNISLCICENVFSSYDNVVMGFCWIKAYGICVNGIGPVP